MLVNSEDGFRTNRQEERLLTVGECFDPVGHSSSSIAHGRIGRAAWALFERGDGMVLSIDLPGEPLCVVPIDSDGEKAAFDHFASSLYVVGKRLFEQRVGK